MEILTFPVTIHKREERPASITTFIRNFSGPIRNTPQLMVVCIRTKSMSVRSQRIIKRIHTGRLSENSSLNVRTAKRSMPPATDTNILTPKSAAAAAKMTAAAAKHIRVRLSVVFVTLSHIETPYHSVL